MRGDDGYFETTVSRFKNSFVTAICACGLAYFLHAPAHAAPAFQIDRPRIALGEPLTLTLNAGPGMLEGLDLKPLAADFEIQGRNLNRSDQAEQLTLTLYPLRTGKFVLPGLGLPNLGLPGRAPTVQVDGESENVPKIRFSLSTEPAAPTVRQPTRLTLEVCDDGSLEWKRPLLPTRVGVYLRPLGEQQMEVEHDAAGKTETCTAHRWHWSLLATAAGPLDLALPMLEAGKFGQRLRFPPPSATLSAAAVPAWLPAEAAVGQAKLSAGPLPETWPINRPLAWRIEISGGYSPTAIKTLLALQLVGHPRLQLYPPSVEALPPETPDDATPRHAVTLYAVPDRTGALVFPNIALPWFDPASGRMQTLTLPGRTLEIIDPLHKKLIWGGIGAVGLSALAFLAHLAWRALRWRLARRRSLKAIANSNDLPALIQAVRSFSLKPGTPPAATLGVWRERGALRAEGLEALIDLLEAASYGTQSVETEILKIKVLEVLGQIRPASQLT
ncbi:MAG: hypothetical protein Q8O79_03090 [Pseudomonadota bacterium]|nr:hypothetical protein [Pseudomonadota bacterium]